MVFQPSKDTAECSFLSAINDVWSSVVLWEMGLSVNLYHCFSRVHRSTDTHINTDKRHICGDTHKHITQSYNEHRHTHQLNSVLFSSVFWPLLTGFALSISSSYLFIFFSPQALLRQSAASTSHLLTEKTSIPHQYTLTREQGSSLKHVGQPCLS